MALIIDDLPGSIRQAKKELRAALPNYREVFAEVEEAISAEAKRIAGQRDRGEDVIPEIQFSDITERRVTADQIAVVKARGACVIRNVFPRTLVRAGMRILPTMSSAIISTSAWKIVPRTNISVSWLSSKPQIYGVYWSKPQVLARQSELLTRHACS